MKKLFFCLVTMILAAGTAVGENYRMQQPSFLFLKVNGKLNVDYVHNPDSAGTVAIATSLPGHVSWVEVKSSGDKLTLSLNLPDGMRDGTVEIPQNLPRVTVYGNYLTRVENDGDSTVRVLTAADVPEFSARVVGNGRLSIRGINADKLKATLFSGRGILVLNGRARQASYSLTGVGTIEADGVTCSEARVKLTGTGAIGVHATDRLTISGSGSGTVYFRGAPDIKKKLSIGLKLQPIE